jgi:CheY-like chemotaxis protein
MTLARMYLLVGLAATGLYFVLPWNSPGQSLVYDLIGVSSALAVVVGGRGDLVLRRAADRGTRMTGQRLILVADDDADILALIKAVLERSGHQVVAVADGAEALAGVRKHKPDLAVLDITMPHINGLEVLRLLRADSETVALPVVLLSAQTQEADVERGFATGASAYMKKPFSPRELAARVAELLT